MLVPVSTQAYIFLCTVFGGIIVGLLYDIFRVLRKSIKTKNIFVYFEDILFWLLVSIIIFAILFISNAGQIRGYAVLGIVLGIIIYAFLISFFVIKLLMKIIEIFKKTMIMTYKFLKRPITWLIKILYFPISLMHKIIRKINKVLSKIFGKVRNNISQNIKNIKTSRKKF